jgi:hypothetical protein
LGDYFVANQPLTLVLGYELLAFKRLEVVDDHRVDQGRQKDTPYCVHCDEVKGESFGCLDGLHC